MLVNTCNVNAREQKSKNRCDLARRRNRKYFVSFLLAFLQSLLRLPTSLVTRSHSVCMTVGDLGEGFTLNIASADASKNMSKESVTCPPS